MELNKNEFKAMQSGFKEWVHEQLDMRMLKHLGLTVTGKNILEIGCGSGYGAELLMKHKPQAYLGIDIMPDQIHLAKARDIKHADFKLFSAAQLSSLTEFDVDEIIDFRILHHIPEWKEVLAQCYKKLSLGGAMYIIEPYRVLSTLADSFLEWQHPEEALFSLAEFENEMNRLGFVTCTKTVGYGFAMQGKKLAH